MSRPKSIWRKCLGREGIRRLEILTLVVISILRVDSAQWVPLPNPVWTSYATNVGGMRRVTLQDGTEVALNTSSEIQVRFASWERDIVLTHGEALFTVMQNPSWPLFIRAGGATIHA